MCLAGQLDEGLMSECEGTELSAGRCEGTELSAWPATKSKALGLAAHDIVTACSTHQQNDNRILMKS